MQAQVEDGWIVWVILLQEAEYLISAKWIMGNTIDAATVLLGQWGSLFVKANVYHN